MTVGDGEGYISQECPCHAAVTNIPQIPVAHNIKNWTISVLEHFHHCREFYWTTRLEQGSANYDPHWSKSDLSFVSVNKVLLKPCHAQSFHVPGTVLSNLYKPPNDARRSVLFYSHFSHKETEVQRDN